MKDFVYDGGVSMDLAKTIAFAALHTDVPMEKYLMYECSTEGLSQLSVVTIPTNPMSGSETNPDVQITIDETGMQKALDVLKKLYQEFGIAFTYGEMAEDPKDHEKLVSIIDSFGPMPCQDNAGDERIAGGDDRGRDCGELALSCSNKKRA